MDAQAPSSHGSLHEGDGRGEGGGEESGFDSDEYREYLPFKTASETKP